LDLWRANGSFRGFAEFAIIGAIVLLFIGGGSHISLPDFGGGLRSLVGGHGSFKPAQSANEIPNFNSKPRPLGPSPADATFDESYFAGAPEVLRNGLTTAWRAYLDRRYDTALTTVSALDGSNRFVALVKAITLLALPGPSNFKDGVQLLQHAADANDTRAMTLLAILNIRGGPGLAPDIDIGKALLERASAAGDAAAARIIGEGYLSGWLGSFDPVRSLQYLQLAAARGDTKAMVRAADQLIAGRGVPKDHAAAEQLLIKAAEANEPEAEGLLGTWMLTKFLSGFTDDPDPALYWLERGAAKFQPNAMYHLGLFYVEHGKRIGRADLPRGVELFRRCTEKTGHSDCMFSLATALDFGFGTRRDPVMAYALYSVLRARSSNPKSAARLQDLAKQLTNDQIAAATALSSQLITHDQGRGQPAGLRQ